MSPLVSFNYSAFILDHTTEVMISVMFCSINVTGTNICIPTSIIAKYKFVINVLSVIDVDLLSAKDSILAARKNRKKTVTEIKF